MQHFYLNILQKYYQIPILGTLDMSGNFYQKRYSKLVETLKFICMQKTSTLRMLVPARQQRWYYLVGNFDDQSVEIYLQENLMLICMQKNQLHL